jgi:hypothetical protein
MGNYIEDTASQMLQDKKLDNKQFLPYLDQNLQAAVKAGQIDGNEAAQMGLKAIGG